MGEKRGEDKARPSVLPVRQLGPAPWAVGNHNHRRSTVVDHQAVGSACGPEVDQSVGAIMSVRMLIALRLNVVRHHLAAMGRHGWFAAARSSTSATKPFRLLPSRAAAAAARRWIAGATRTENVPEKGLSGVLPR